MPQSSNISNARERNRQAAKDVTGDVDVSGGVMPRDLFDRFFQRIQDTSRLLDMCRVEELPRPKMSLARIGVGERQRRDGDPGNGNGGVGEVNTDQIDMDVDKATLTWDLKRDTIEDTIDDVPNIVMNKMGQQWSTDTQELAINAREDATADNVPDGDTGFFGERNGWLKILRSRVDGTDINGDPLETSTNVYEHGTDSTPEPVNTKLFNDAIQTLPNKYKRSDEIRPVFMMNEDHLQAYKYSLTEREDPLGGAVLFGDQDITPFDYDVYGFSGWPLDTAVFTYPQNFVYGIWRDVEMEVLTDTDKTAEYDLFARYFMRVRDDFQVDDEEGAVLIENIDPASATVQA